MAPGTLMTFNAFTWKELQLQKNTISPHIIYQLVSQQPLGHSYEYIFSVSLLCVYFRARPESETSFVQRNCKTGSRLLTWLLRGQ